MYFEGSNSNEKKKKKAFYREATKPVVRQESVYDFSSTGIYNSGWTFGGNRTFNLTASGSW